MSAAAPHRSTAQLAAMRERPEPAKTVAELHTFTRSPKYQIRAVVKERDGARWLSLAGFMLTVNGWFPAQQRVNFGLDELNALADAIGRAKAILS